MADTTLQKEEVESYVREELAKKFETALEERGVPLKDVIGNGQFKFDAVDADITIAVNISTVSPVFGYFYLALSYTTVVILQSALLTHQKLSA